MLLNMGGLLEAIQEVKAELSYLDLRQHRHLASEYTHGAR